MEPPPAEPPMTTDGYVRAPGSEGDPPGRALAASGSEIPFPDLIGEITRSLVRAGYLTVGVDSWKNRAIALTALAYRVLESVGDDFELLLTVGAILESMGSVDNPRRWLALDDSEGLARVVEDARFLVRRSVTPPGCREKNVAKRFGWGEGCRSPRGPGRSEGSG